MNILDRPEIPYENLQIVVENAFNGLKTFNILKSSVEMGVFDNLTSPTTSEELSHKLDIEPIFSYYILEALFRMGLIEKENDLYRNSKLSGLYLNSNSKYNRIKCILSLDENVNLWNNLTDTLKGDLSKRDESFFPFII